MGTRQQNFADSEALAPNHCAVLGVMHRHNSMPQVPSAREGALGHPKEGVMNALTHTVRPQSWEGRVKGMLE